MAWPQSTTNYHLIDKKNAHHNQQQTRKDEVKKRSGQKERNPQKQKSPNKLMNESFALLLVVVFSSLPSVCVCFSSLSSFATFIFSFRSSFCLGREKR